MKHYKTIILGAGVTGLYLAKSLLEKDQKSVLILEKNNYVGGMCSSQQLMINNEAYILDYGPHKLFSLLPGIMEEFKSINGENNLTVKKINSLFFLDKKFQFPIRPLEMLKNISPKTISAGITIPASLLKSMITYNILRKKDNSFEDYLIKGFGKKAYQMLFESYAWKVWADPELLSKEIAEIRIPVPNIGNLIKNTINPFNKKEQVKINAAEFYYPKYGMKQFVENLAKNINQKKGEILLGKNILTIGKKNKQFLIKTKTKIGAKIETETYSCDNLISTIPLNNFIELYEQATPEIKETIFKLKHNDLTLIYLFFNQPQVINDNWIFFPELEYSFNRLSEQKSFSPFTIPKDKTVLCAEITNPKINGLSDEEIIARVKQDLMKAKIINNEEKIFNLQIIRLKNIYPIYNLQYKDNLQKILNFLDDEEIITLGRYGLFNYNNIDHCLDMGKKCAEHLMANKSISEWKETRKSFFEYKIVD